MDRFGRIAMIFGVGVLAAVGITGALAGPGGSLVGSLDGSQQGDASRLGDDSSSHDGTEVLGDVIDCPPEGPGPEDVKSKFETDGTEFEVIGALASFDGTTVAVTGPSGDVSADLGLDFELKGDLTPGTPVKMEGKVAADSTMTAREVESACAGVGVIDCPAGEDPRFKIEVEGNTFEVVGTLDSLTDTLVSVLGPGALVEATVDAGTEINIDQASPAGTPVKVEGTIDGDTFVARQVNSACEDEVVPDDQNEVDDEDEDEVEAEDEDCNRGPGEHGDLRVKIEGNEIEIERGTVLSFDGGVLMVDAPAGPFTVMIDAGTEVDGDLSLATEVRVEGTLTDGASVQAEEVKTLCPDAAHHDDADDADDDNDVQGEDHDADHDHGDDDSGGSSGSDSGSGSDDDGDNSGSGSSGRGGDDDDSEDD